MLILKFNLTECCKSLKRALNVGFPLNNFDSCLTQSKIEYLWLMFWIWLEQNNMLFKFKITVSIQNSVQYYKVSTPFIKAQ